MANLENTSPRVCRFHRISLGVILLLALAEVAFPDTIPALETSIRSPRIQMIQDIIWRNDFKQAIDSCRKLVTQEPSNPVGYFILGAIYYNISNQFRTDRYNDSLLHYLDTSIVLSGAKLKESSDQADWYFVRGSAYGCRALHRSIHGGWWGAYRDGQHSCDNLKKAIKKDSSLLDTYLGIGAYHYWKSSRLRKLAWLPFVSENRQEGIDELFQAAEGGGLMSLDARKCLLPIYLNERRHTDAVACADSLLGINSEDANCLLHKARALVELKRWDEFDLTLADLQKVWNSSVYSDSCGALEALYLKAKSLDMRGNTAGKQELISRLHAAQENCGHHSYFRETTSKAKDLNE